jgi:hypothetical protein
MKGYKFGKRSMRYISTLEQPIQDVLLTAIKTSPMDFCVISGHRGKVEQNKYFTAGTGLEWPLSKHNTEPSQAFDFAPYHRVSPHIHWNAIDEFVTVAKHIIKTAKDMDIELRSGRDWDRDGVFNEPGEFDGPHIERVDSKPKKKKAEA